MADTQVAEVRASAAQTFDLQSYPYADRMSRSAYEAEKAALQVELLKVQHWVQDTRQKMVLLFEGRDAAGKGGTIKRFMEHLNPRAARDEQRRRFEARKTDPLKQWKLSPIDRASLDKWDDYTEAKEAMFFYTDTADAPWTVIKSNDKKRARINCMNHFLACLDYPDKDPAVATPPDPALVHHAERVVHASEHILAASLHPKSRKT